ncbi:MAG TPA: rhodanese-like domain-containing protein [Candidatus Limnocylindrales bacterium]|nr:rhodanese-like domain-containing protein [Candidatus Limnocylindrales bacterium]
MPPSSIADLLDAARTRIDRVASSELAAEMARGALVIDTRCGEDRLAHGVIPGSVPVPLSVLFWRLDPTSGFDDTRLSDRTRRVILVCTDGYSSSLAAATLRDVGFDKAADLDGGFSAYVAAGCPIERINEVAVA